MTASNFFILYNQIPAVMFEEKIIDLRIAHNPYTKTPQKLFDTLNKEVGTNKRQQSVQDYISKYGKNIIK